MPLYLVRSKTGAALVRADDEMNAKLNVIDSCFVDAADLDVYEFDPILADFPNSVFEFKSFVNGDDLSP